MAASPLIFFNPNAGTGNKKHIMERAVRNLLPEARIVELKKNTSVDARVKHELEKGTVIFIAAGGDGTVSALAGALVKMKSPAKLGIIPLGTLNHFARDLEIPRSIYRSVDIILRGSSKFIDVASVNRRCFLNNSNLGLYPYIVSERDSIKRSGVRKWFRALRASVKALRRYPYVDVEFESAGKRFRRKTPFVFVGNNMYDMGTGRLGTRHLLNQGKLQLLIAHKVSRLRLVHLVWHALRGTLIEQRDFDCIGLSQVTIRSRRKKLKVSHDGEIELMHTPIRYSILPQALHVIIP